MAVTIQQIAEAAGVSRGTVDRALNNRGRINPEVAEKIKQIAEEMGYISKHKKKKEGTGLKIGVVTQLARSSFMQEVNRGISDARELLQERGVEVVLKEGYSVDEKEQLSAIEELEKEGIDGLALMPVDCESIRVKINELIEKNIPVITFNSDIVGTKRSCFVGMDNRKSGKTAAGLMGMLTRGTGKVLIITGFFSNHVNSTRVDGFIEEMKLSYPGMEVAGVQGSFDDAQEVEKIIVNTMLAVPGITGIFVVSGGQEGIAKAYQQLQLDKRPYTIIYDRTPENKEALEMDVADFLIDQEGYVQGYEPPCILADLLLKKQEAIQEFHHTEINIKTKYNI
ncbi:MAG: LacI family DNA-binding transcriptional regulator [Clostridiales bacterium]|nr:LacI family DNA-binding transcriptional regulator [Clostridiales bacterium]